MARRGILCAAVLAVALLSAADASAVTVLSASGALTAGDPDQVDRLSTLDPTDTCASSNGVSAAGVSGTYNSDRYAVSNLMNNSPCITVTIDPQTCVGATGLVSGAYSPNSLTSNVVTNGLADIGASPTASKSYSFNAPALSPFQINVHELNAGALCAAYSISVDSLQPFANAVPVLSGRQIQGGTVTGSTGTWLGSPTFTHQWRRCDSAGASCSDIVGATTASYTPTAGDRGSTLRDRVFATEAGQTSSADSLATAPIGAPIIDTTGSINTSDPSQTGRVLRDGVRDSCAFSPTPLVANDSTARHYDVYNASNINNGPVCVAVNVDASACPVAVFTAGYAPSFNPASIITNGLGDAGASSPAEGYSFNVAPGTFAVNVHEVTPGAGCSSYGITVASIQPLASTLPAISGTTTVSEQLTAAPGTWNGNPAFGFQWRRCDGGGSCADIDGATSGTYAPAPADAGSTLRVRVSATEGSQTAAADSAATALIAPDTTAPSAPTLTGTTPASGSSDNNPRVQGSAEAGAQISLFESSDCSGAAAASGTAGELGDSGIAIAVPSDATTQISATATDASNNTSPCSGSIAYAHKTPPPTPPDTTITNAKQKVKTTKRKAKVTFEFVANVAGARFECQLDGGDFSACTSPDTVKVKIGKHTFAVRAKSSAGTIDPTPAEVSFTVKRKPRHHHH